VPTLAQVLAAPACRNLPAVLERMRAIDAAVPERDGVAWFTKLYLGVTEAIAEAVAGTAFRDPEFLVRLDVVFANLYFASLRDWLADADRAPRAWAPLYSCRKRKRVAPIQFALAGMNAHVNRDLPVALVAVCRERGVDLSRAKRQHEDYVRVNPLLAVTEAKVKRWFATGFVGVVDVALGSEDDRIAMWNVGRARDAAWVNAQALWTLRGLPILQRRYLATLDRTVGFAGRGLLVPVV
jgi:Family of unknown function (DUF5995)